MGLIVVLMSTDGVVAAGDTEAQPPHCYVYRQSDQLIRSGRTTTVLFRPAKIGKDVHGMFDPSVPDRLRSPGNHVYLVTGHVTFQANSKGTRVVYIEENNGRSGWRIRAMQRISAPRAGRCEMTITTSFAVDPGDHVRLRVRQSSGRMLRLLDTDHSPKLMLTCLHEQY
jgi:hypothetical protein